MRIASYDGEVCTHDHFDGSANCVECEGPCRLAGMAMAYTALLRALFEAEAMYGQRIPYMAEVQMRRAGVDVDAMRERAARAAATRPPR